MSLPKLQVGAIYEGRGIRIRLKRIGLGVVLIELLTPSGEQLPEKFRIHPWRIESMEGMSRVYG